MLVLGIESSCDETAAALVREDGTVLADVVASQIAVHAPYGGVVPELASRAHLTNVLPVIEGALAEVEGGLDAVDAIAVTQGPGLVGALLVGVQAAKAIAWARDLPIVGVDHLVGHLFAVYLRRGEGDPPQPTLPYVALLVSGGHTAIYEVTAPGEAHILGQTRDDAAGEAFDKVAKLLGLGYPGGPVVDRLAASGDPRAIELPIPMASRRTLDFSFSGLKTAVARHVEAHGVPEDEAGMADLCASFQRSVTRVLARKAVHACVQRGIPRLVLGGGVAANRGLRETTRRLAAKHDVALFVPPLASCTDNAAMIAYAGALRLAAGERDDLTLSAYSRSPDVRRGKFPKRRTRP
ncbi:MAG: tRNA (adenosine(37)-N6)-threonylcarbamoyltransferase complex transferase subunit TsaD [Sandaracinaceae bacterium]|nr:MAG: tRNA (adenosine(37)-N6)-threonylcarbamoyltransferase complex transferase subunit TsaD [Sandaracinaceae bacterium]